MERQESLKEFFIDSEIYENIQASIQMLTLITLAENDIRKGDVYDSNDVFSELEEKHSINSIKRKL